MQSKPCVLRFTVSHSLQSHFKFDPFLTSLQDSHSQQRTLLMKHMVPSRRFYSFLTFLSEITLTEAPLSINHQSVSSWRVEFKSGDNGSLTGLCMGPYSLLILPMRRLACFCTIRLCKDEPVRRPGKSQEGDGREKRQRIAYQAVMVMHLSRILITGTSSRIM